MSIHQILTKLNNRDSRLFPKFSTLTWAIIITFFILTGSFISHTLKAQETETNIISEYAQTIEEGNPNLENWNSSNMDNNILKTLDTLVGTKNIADSIGNPGVSFIPGGATGITTNLIANLYTPPISGIQYLAQLKDNFLGKPAYAQQGTGFTGLQPLLPIWRGFRNVVYILSSIAFVVIGLLIMFRIKTGPQTIVSIQNTIPKIIITLILVTFSYAIAGLLIDLMNLIQGLSLTILFSATGKKLTDNLISGGNHFNFSSLADSNLTTIFHLTYKAVPLNILTLFGVVIGAILGAIVGGVPTGGIGAPLGALVGTGIGTVIVILIVIIAIFIWQIKFFFGLIQCYVTIILRIIIAPLEIFMGAIPGVKIGFSTWIRDIIANLAVFPISLLFLILANIIIEATQGGDFWTPGLLSSGGFPGLIASISGGLIPAAIGIFTILLMSKLPKMIPEFIFQIKPSPWGTAIGESTTGMGKITGPGSTAGLQYASQEQQQRWLDYEREAETPSGKLKVANAIFDTIGLSGKIKRRP